MTRRAFGGRTHRPGSPDGPGQPTSVAPPPLVGRHHEVKAILADPVRFTAGRDALDLGQRRPVLPLQAEPDDHRRIRAAMEPPFTPQAVRELEARVGGHARRLIETFRSTGRTEFNATFGRWLPFYALVELLDLPPADLEHLAALHEGILGSPTVPVSEPERAIVGDQVYAYFEAIVAARRHRTGTDLISTLHARRRESEAVSEHEIVDICYLLLLAGVDPVSNVLASLVAHLAQHSDRSSILADPAAFRRTTEELLRWGAAVKVITRISTTETEVGDHRLPDGSRVALSLTEANRDPLVFPDPERFDPERATAAHLAFGHGAHRCIGIHLARLQLRITAVELEHLLPGYRIDPAAEPPPSPATIGAADHLHLVWTV